MKKKRSLLCDLRVSSEAGGEIRIWLSFIQEVEQENEERALRWEERGVLKDKKGGRHANRAGLRGEFIP
jgi:hypothetical protein